MMRFFKKFKQLAMLVSLFSILPPQALLAQEPPYKLGMFQEGNRHFVGLVLDDAQVIDLSRAQNNAPASLRELIERWDANLAGELLSLAGSARQSPPAYALPLDSIRILPPLEDPDVLLMAARNYQEHAEEMANAGRTSGTSSVIDESVLVGLPGIWNREAGDQRPNPFLFPKLKSAISASGDPVILPPGRTNIDYECELVAIIGRNTRHVGLDEALDYVFGYTLMLDVSDREERPDGRYGSDWFMGKSHDTFAPSGPFVVPAEFVGDPQDLEVRYTLNGELMQNANTELMIHTVKDLVSFASQMVTLRPGDMIGTGTPGGVGEGRTPPVYFQDGDQSVCMIEKIGTLINPIRQAE
jgi:2,4-diketo-3-deoxy-L-fuconate hydrolase